MEQRRGYQGELWGAPTVKGQAQAKQPKQGCEKQEGVGGRETRSDGSRALGSESDRQEGVRRAGGGQGPLGTKCPETNLPVLQGGYSQPTASPHTAEMEFYLHLDFPKGSLTP